MFWTCAGVDRKFIFRVSVYSNTRQLHVQLRVCATKTKSAPLNNWNGMELNEGAKEQSVIQSVVCVGVCLNM